MDSFDERPDDFLKPRKNPVSFYLFMIFIFIPVVTVTILLLLAYYGD